METFRCSEMIFCLLIFITFCHKPSTQCEVQYLDNYSLTIFDDKAISDFLMETNEGVDMLWMCTLKCRDNLQCRSYQFNNLTKRCSLFGVGFYQPGETISVTMETGARLYLMFGRLQSYGMQCASKEDCSYENSFCSQGSCQCAVGYSYQLSTGNCVVGCPEYRDSFSVYVDHGVDDCNEIVMTDITAAVCMDACREETSFLCINVEYNPSKLKCHLCDKAWLDLPVADRVTDDFGWNLFYRQCIV